MVSVTLKGHLNSPLLLLQPKSSVSTVADAYCPYLIPLYLQKLTCKYHWTSYSSFILIFSFFVIVMTILSDLWILYKSSMDTHSQFACKMSSFLEGNS
jgi:hypothetical protein